MRKRQKGQEDGMAKLADRYSRQKKKYTKVQTVRPDHDRSWQTALAGGSGRQARQKNIITEQFQSLISIDYDSLSSYM